MEKLGSSLLIICIARLASKETYADVAEVCARMQGNMPTNNEENQTWDCRQIIHAGKHYGRGTVWSGIPVTKYASSWPSEGNN